MDIREQLEAVGLPTLIGTEQQVKMANNIRNGFIAAFVTHNLDWQTIVETAKTDKKVNMECEKLMKTSAKWWIAFRNEKIFGLCAEKKPSKHKNDETDLICPKCGGTIVVYNKGFRCTNDYKVCGFKIWRESYGVTITQDIARELITERKTSNPISGVLVGDQHMSARLELTDDFKVRPLLVPNCSSTNCPRCGSNKMMNMPYGGLICTVCRFHGY